MPSNKARAVIQATPTQGPPPSSYAAMPLPTVNLSVSQSGLSRFRPPPSASLLARAGRSQMPRLVLRRGDRTAACGHHRTVQGRDGMVNGSTTRLLDDGPPWARC
ncbi:uncharacterized protein B0I36DRAFT_324287 [Microdochium trichocladiopsis]|uniref:Uncharacterized protein n=1 Tax=Microdochium trichocladiopsis TaxID=1682393 RepID=A0A9P8Y785_9PEZI|nr:uncharacterized protein B0I36DRAFT_324287 [Microdochium trichocladiopsis]KAH7031601.1 hypothetical protein B0I36DRAFT_324287 [Microdochium trichocladiopsis]